MAAIRAAQLRRLWLNVHLWIGVGLALLLIPISISGGLLVFDDHVDALFSPQRYAVTGSQIALPPSGYLAKAAEATAAEPGNMRVTGVRFPDAAGWPIRVGVRGAAAEGGGRPRSLTVYLDPPTGNVLGVVDFRSSLIGTLHVFHENLMLPQYNGRQIVGWAGVGMLILSLTGIWLWWPRKTSWRNLLRSLRWTRSTLFTFNLHNMLGFWIALPLAAVSLTGIYLSFPQTSREMMSSIAPMNPQGQRGPGAFNAEIATQTELTPDRALEIAQKAETAATPLSVNLPTMQRGGGGERGAQGGAGERAGGGERNGGGERAGGQRAGGGERAGGGGGLTWRIQMTRTATDETVTIMVDDRAGRATLAPGPQSGDRAASWIRWIHEGSHSGFIWAFIVFLTGVFPTIFAITGIIMWLRKRAGRKALLRPQATGALRPAE